MGLLRTVKSLLSYSYEKVLPVPEDSDMVTKLYPYQREGVKLIERFQGRALLADDMGLGKTVQALFYLKNHPDIRPAVVICPASLKWNWEAEARNHIGMMAEVIEGKKVPRSGLRGFKSTQLFIINYDILSSWVDHIIEDVEPMIVFADECHYLKNPNAKRTKAVKKLARVVPYFTGISGTPLTNRPSELFPVLNMVRPDLYPSFLEFAHRYCEPKLTHYGWRYDGAARLPELHKKLRRQMMIRRLKEDVLEDLPPKTRTVVPLDIDDRKQYDMAVRDFIGWMRKHNPKALKTAIRAQALTKIGYLKRLAARLKQKSVMSWIDNFLEQTDEKLMLFGCHYHMIDALAERYKRICTVVTGEVKGRKRQQAFDQFNRDPKTRLFLGNLSAAGVGWSCKSSSTVAFAEMGWTPGEHTQAEDRGRGLFRGVKGKALSAYYLIAKGTIEENIVKLVNKKQKTLDTVLDTGENASQSVFNELVDMLLGRDSHANEIR